MDYRAASSNKRYYVCSKVDIEFIKDEVLSIIDYDYQQMMLQSVPNGDHQYGVGRLEKYKESEDLFCVPVFPELRYTNEIIKRLRMYRSRIMIMRNGCYSWHADSTPRIHIPIITDIDKCFMVVEDEVIRMPVSEDVYWVDTTREHTFVNTSNDNRVHIVGCVS